MDEEKRWTTEKSKFVAIANLGKAGNSMKVAQASACGVSCLQGLTPAG
jgi:hypothetical protein